MSRFTQPIVEVLVAAAEQGEVLTYGEMTARLTEGYALRLSNQGAGRQLYAVHRLLLDQTKAQGVVVPPLTAIVEDRHGVPGNGLTPVLAEWLAASGAFPAMVRDARAAAAAGAAPPPHVLRFSRTQVHAFRGWRAFVAAIPAEAFAAARAGHHSEIDAGNEQSP